MGTTSSFFGGGGGGGDPQANFQASANVTSGDLVVLNDNGTVEPVTSTANLVDMTSTDNGTKIAAEGTRNYATTGKWGIYNPTLDKYVFAVAGDGNNYETIHTGTYNDSTEEFTLTFRGQFAGYASRLSDKFSPNNGLLYAYIGTNQYLYVRGLYGSTYAIGGETTFASGYMRNGDVYVNTHGEGSSDLTVGGINDGYISFTHGTWNGTSSSIVATAQINETGRRFTSEGTSWSSNSFAGVHVKNDIHVYAAAKSGELYIGGVQCNADGTTFGTILNTGINPSSNYKSIAYDPVTNIGLIRHYASSTAKATPFSINTSSLTITKYPDISIIGLSSTGSVMFHPTAKKFTLVDNHSFTRDVEVFELSASGVKTNGTTHRFFPTSSSNPQTEHSSQFPVTGTGKVGMVFNAGGTHSVGGNYIDTGNHSYVTQFSIPFTNTNVDSHFGEAKEAITSGSAGPIAMLNRSIDIEDSSFQKGQKLFANPSGTALATSGTYRVGYASDADTVIVTGDPS